MADVSSLTVTEPLAAGLTVTLYFVLVTISTKLLIVKIVSFVLSLPDDSLYDTLPPAASSTRTGVADTAVPLLSVNALSVAPFVFAQENSNTMGSVLLLFVMVNEIFCVVLPQVPLCAFALKVKLPSLPLDEIYVPSMSAVEIWSFPPNADPSEISAWTSTVLQGSQVHTIRKASRSEKNLFSMLTFILQPPSFSVDYVLNVQSHFDAF